MNTGTYVFTQLIKLLPKEAFDWIVKNYEGDNYDRKSMIILSQLTVDKWYEYIAEPTFTDAIMDRLVNNAIHIELKGYGNNLIM